MATSTGANNTGHAITVEPTRGRVRVMFAGEVIVDSTRALTLTEGSMAGVQYIPREDAVAARLVRTAHSSHCPYKGDASYFSIAATDGKRAENAVWTYEHPLDAVSAIAGHLAFYPSRVDSISVDPA